MSRKVGEWEYIKSTIKDWYVDDGREFGPVFIMATEESARQLCELLNYLHSEIRRLSQPEAIMVARLAESRRRKGPLPTSADAIGTCVCGAPFMIGGQTIHRPDCTR